jgi:hypothetical protein
MVSFPMPISIIKKPLSKKAFRAPSISKFVNGFSRMKNEEFEDYSNVKAATTALAVSPLDPTRAV